MEEQFKPSERLPDTFKVVLVKRKHSDLVLASRNGEPLATSSDLSRDCHWRGVYLSSLNSGLYAGSGIDFDISFQDGTVEWWCELSGAFDSLASLTSR